MNRKTYPRAALADQLLSLLTHELDVIEVGDAVAPSSGGWAGGQPGQGPFRPYVVVTAGTGVHNLRDPAGKEDTSWKQNVSLRFVGSMRSQVDWTGDQVRDVIAAIYKEPLDDDWTILKVEFIQIGAIARSDNVDPPEWEAVDSVAVWLERST